VVAHTVRQESASALSVGRLCGAEIKLDRSCWFVTAGAFIVALAIARTALGFSPLDAFVLAVASAALLLCINLAHEVGHVIVGAALAIKSKEVVVKGWGAKTTHSGGAHSPRDLALVSLAGPGGNLAVAAFAGAALPFVGVHGLGLIAALYCAINVAYAALNLAPLYPRDGGRVVYALLWHTVKDEQRSEMLARQIGIALVLAALALCVARGELLWSAFALILGGEGLAHDLGAMLRQKASSSKPAS
jgi:Zn-dependent protease